MPVNIRVQHRQPERLVKNLPHQFNRLPRLKAVLATARDIGRRTADDDDFGYEMARRGVYTFRRLVTSIDDRIAAERLKPRGSQGAQTAARDLRRLLTDLGFFEGPPSWALAPLGVMLLDAPAGSVAETDVWRAAIADLSVTGEDGNTSHPGCILLRLLADTGGLPKHALGLALEPSDDSEPEYERARALTGLDTVARRATLGITRYVDEDSVKILPALAQQAGLIEEVDGLFHLTGEGFAAHAACAWRSGRVSEATGPPPAGAPGATAALTGRRTRVRHGRAGASRARRWVERPAGLEPGELDAADFRALTPEEQREAARLRRERTKRHNAVVAALAGLASSDGVDLHEDPISFDLLVEPADEHEPLVLIEVKTLDEDAETQARAAIGQLIWYRHRVVVPRWPDRSIESLAVFDGPVPDAVIEVFDALDIGVAVNDRNGYRAIGQAAERTKRRFGA